MRINGHSHLLPYPSDIPSFMRDREIFWVDEDRTFMRQKGWQRPITDTSFFLDEKLAWMEKHHLDHAVVLNLSQLYGNGLPKEDRELALRFQNDFNAGVEAKHPSKFTCGFVVHPADIDVALNEIRRCVEEHKMSLLCLPTHYMDDEGYWSSVFEKDCDPIFELANELHLAVEVHPYDGEKFIKLKNSSWRFHLVWMLAQCADAYHFLTLNDYANRYPNMRICFAHGGQLAQANLGRRIQGYDGRPDLFEGQLHPRKSVRHPNIFFDTLVHDTGTLALLIKNQGTHQVILGLDDPYPLGEMEFAPQCSYPGKILDLAVAEKLITTDDKTAMSSDNIIRWLYGDDKQKKAAFVKRVEG